MEECKTSRKRRGLKYAGLIQHIDARRCPGCGVKILGNHSLTLHLLTESECLRYHFEEGKGHFVSELRVEIIPGTVRIIRATTSPTTKPWAAVGVSPSGLIEMRREKTRYLIRDWINAEFGPVEFAR